MCECVCVHDTLGYLHKGVHADRRCTEFICDGGPRCLATTDTVSWTDVLKCAMTLRHCWDTWTACCWFTGQCVSDCNRRVPRAYSRNLDSYRCRQGAGDVTEGCSPAADRTVRITCVRRITKCRAIVSSVQHTSLFRRLRFQPESSHLQHAVSCACHRSPLQ